MTTPSIEPKCQAYRNLFLECEEFKELTEEVNIFGSFSLIDDKQADTISTCSATAGLVVGGVDANPNEFPHMVSSKIVQ